MSFPKAKIQRFNEVKVPTPSPADYNVKEQNKPKCTFISQTDRFAGPSSPTTSDNLSSSSLPLFRTPTLPKKKKSVLSLKSPKPKLKNLFKKTKNDEELNEKIVECANKDAYIKELTEHMEEMRTKLGQVEAEKIKLEERNRLIKEESKLLNDEHDNVVKATILKYRQKLDNLKGLGMKVNEEIQKIKEECLTLKEENRQDMMNVLKNIDHIRELCQKCHDVYMKEITLRDEKIQMTENVLNAECAKMQKQHSDELKELEQKHEAELVDIRDAMMANLDETRATLESEKVSIQAKLQQIESERDSDLRQFNEEKARLIEENNAKIKLLEQNFEEMRMLNEIQTKERMQDVENEWKLKLESSKKESEAILKECQEISEYNIIQSEIEKNQLKCELAGKEEIAGGLRKQIEEISEKYVALTENCGKLQNQLDDITKEVHEEREKHKAEKMDLQQFLTEKKAYEITINNSQETIEVLKKRLINSDKDVEILKQELTDLEAKTLQNENKCEQLTSELQQLKEINEGKDFEMESMVKVTEERVKLMEQRLIDRVDGEFKKVQGDKVQFEEVCQQLHEQLTVNHQAQLMIAKANKEVSEMESQLKDAEGKLGNSQEKMAKLETENLEKEMFIQGYQTKQEMLEKQIVELEDQCKNFSQHCEYYKNKATELEAELAEAADIRKRYIEKSGKYDGLLQQFEQVQKDNAAFQKLIADQESLIGPFREQLEAYEIERNALLNEKTFMENEAKEVGRKYAEMLGHQNHRQKIKHLVDLKNKNLELAQNNLELESKVRKCLSHMEKLKKENGELKKSARKGRPIDDKENLDVSLNTSVSSPCPLRDRN